MNYLVNLDLSKNQILNPVLHNLALPPSAPVEGQFYYNTADKRMYTWNGTAWFPNDGIGASMTGADIVTAINASASVIDKDNLYAFTKTDVGLSNVTNDAQVKKLASSTSGNIPTWNGTTGDALGAGYTVETTLTGGAGAIPRADAVKTYVDALLGASDAMVFKGTLGTGGTITAIPSAYNAGWTYKVITAGTYAGIVCEVGDLIVAIVDRASAGVDADWIVVQTNTDGAVTGPVSSTDGNFALYNGATGKIIKDGGVNSSSFAASGHNHDGTYSKKYTTTIGGATSVVVTHNLNTRALTYSIARTASPYDAVIADVELTTVNTLTVKFAVAPSAGEYTITVIG